MSEEDLLNPCCPLCFDGKNRRVERCNCLCHEDYKDYMRDDEI